MYLLKLRKSEDDTTVTLPADVIEALHLAEEEYRTNRDLTDFEAFGEDDLYDEYADEE